MGLDMYLLKDFKETDEDYKKEAYWRKANAIHNWFVNNVQNGVDDCGYYVVPKDQLEKLLEIVKEVLADHSKAKKLLPTTAGFFFGSTDYDEWYFKDLEDTKAQVTKTLEHMAVDPNSTYKYHSSW